MKLIYHKNFHFASFQANVISEFLVDFKKLIFKNQQTNRVSDWPTEQLGWDMDIYGKVLKNGLK